MADASQSGRLQSLSILGRSLVAVALALVVFSSWVVSDRSISAIDASKLANYQKSLHSYASEGLLLVKQYRAGRALSNYTEVSARKLYEAVADTGQKLQIEHAEDGLFSRVSDLSGKATQLSDTLAQLSQAPSQDEVNGIVDSLELLRSELK
jgi:hypothetical protein